MLMAQLKHERAKYVNRLQDEIKILESQIIAIRNKIALKQHQINQTTKLLEREI